MTENLIMKGCKGMFTEGKKEKLAAKISSLPDEQVEAVEKYLLELTDMQLNRSETGEKYLTFLCDNQSFGINILQISQIIQVPQITPLPNFVPYIRGMVNLRENVIPIMDLRLRLGKPEKQYNAQTCILIVTVADKPFGLIVDAVNNVETIRNEEINDPPRQGGGESSYLIGIAKKESIILILDVATLLAPEELDSLIAVSKETDSK